jgi:hypothetical protein
MLTREADEILYAGAVRPQRPPFVAAAIAPDVFGGE